MNRENKRKKYEKNYYKNHPCNEAFVCKNCGKTVVPTGAGSDHRNHCPYCLHSQHLDVEPGDREADCGGLMEPVSESGQSFIDAKSADLSVPTELLRMIIP